MRFSPFASAFTGILILEKGIPHLKTKEVFFARVENDGFRMKKNVRLPRLGNQLTTVLDAYFNKKSISRLCGWVLLDDKDPLWHPAAPHHVPTSMLTLDEIADGVRELGTARASFVVQHATALLTLNDDVKRGKITPQSLKDIKKPFQSIAASSTIGTLFDIYGGQRELHNKEALLPGRSLVISASGTDNGAYGFFDFPDVLAPPFATVPGTGSIGQAFVQEWPCGVTDHCYILVPKAGVPTEMLYVACAVIRREAWRFSYGAQITPRRIEWFPVPTGDDVVALVREQLASAKRVEGFALEETEDQLDAFLAKERLREIAQEPTKVLTGQALDTRLMEWLSE